MITEIILSVIAGIFAGGVPASILFFRANKHKAEAEAELAKAQAEQQNNANAIALANEYRDLAEKRETQLDQREQLVNRLYAEIGDWRRRNTELEVWKAQNEYRICEVRGCTSRTPPTGF